MKEIIENASSDLPKTDTFLPPMTVANKMKTTFNKEMQNKDKMNNQFYRTGKISIIKPFNNKKQPIGTSSKLTMNLQV